MAFEDSPDLTTSGSLRNPGAPKEVAVADPVVEETKTDATTDTATTTPDGETK